MRLRCQITTFFRGVSLACVSFVPCVFAQESEVAPTIPLDQEIEESNDTASPTSSQELSTEEQIRIRSLYEQLSDNAFQVREQATADLILSGDKSVPFLKQLQTEKLDPEATARLKLIVDRIETNGLPKRIDAFMASPSDIKKHGFYGWSEFAAIAGTNRVARRLFVQLLERHQRLCKEEVSNDQLKSLQLDVVKALKEIRHTTGETSVADAVVLQYMMIRLGKDSSEELERLTAELVKYAPYSRELNVQEGTSTLKRITGQWMTTVQRDLFSPLIVSLNYRLKEGAILARKILKEEPSDEMTYNIAMQTLLVFGDQEDISLVEGFFNNEKIVFRENDFADGLVVEVQQQYRDLALATAIQLRGLKMTEFFPEAQPHHLRGYNPTTLRFLGPNSDAQRKAAFERYRQSVETPQKVD